MWLKHSQHSLTTLCPTLCLAWQLLNVNSFFWLQQFSSPCLSLSALKQKFVCWSTSCRRYVCWEFPINFFSKKITFINILSNKQNSEVKTDTLQPYSPWLVGKILPWRDRGYMSMTESLALRHLITAIHLSRTSSAETPPL